MQKTHVFQEIKTWKRPFHRLYAKISSLYLKILPNVEVIGITGSVGKTLTQNAIYSVLSQKFHTVVGNENLDPTFRIPKTILKTKPWDQKLILEYGVEHPEDMDYYLKIAKPKVAILTLIAPTHTKYFKNVQGVFEEKVKLVKVLPKNGYAILNADDPFSYKAKNSILSSTFWFGQRAKGGVKISHFTQNLKGSKFRLHYKGQMATVSWKIIGKHHLMSVYISATLGIINGLKLKQIATGLSKTKVPKHRLNLISRKNFTIIDDAYNSSPKASEQSITTLVDLGKRKTKIAVLGEMKDLGTISNSAHVALGQKIAKTKINYLITVGKKAEIIADSAKKTGFTRKIIKTQDSNKAIEAIKKLNLKGSMILVKGSRHAHLERIVLALLGKSTKINCYYCGELNRV